MRREVTWTEKLPDRTHREVRVHFHGGKTYWRERISASRRARPDERWNTDCQPTEEDWDRLLQEVRDRYQRRTARQEDIDVVLSRATGTGRPPGTKR